MKILRIIVALIYTAYTTVSFAEGLFAQNTLAKNRFQSLLSPEEYKTSMDHKYSFLLTGDQHMSSFATSSLAMSGIELYRILNDRVVESYEHTKLMQAGLIIVGLYVSRMIVTTNHEIGGHGFRFKEAGMSPTYKVRLNMSGHTTVDAAVFTDKFWNGNYRAYQDATVNAAGVQAGYVLSEEIKKRLYSSGKIDPVYGMAYNASVMDQFNYIWLTGYDDTARSVEGHDIQNYIFAVNAFHYSSQNGSNHSKCLTKSKVKSYALLDLLDPFLYFSTYSALSFQRIDIPMIRVGAVGYLPATRLVLAPYGIETKLINHFKVDDKYVRVSLTYGENLQHKSYAVDVFVDKLFVVDKLSFGGQVAVWSQPKVDVLRTEEYYTIFPKKVDVLLNKSEVGFMILANAEIGINENLTGFISGGYKTFGFVEGRQSKASPLIQAGLRVNF